MEPRKFIFLFLLAVVITMTAESFFTGGLFGRNLAGLSILHHSPDEKVISTLKQVALTDCSANWLLGLELTGRDQEFVWKNLLVCDETAIELVKVLASPELAEFAVLNHPDSSRAWFWLGETVENTDKKTALSYYQTATTIDKTNGFSWCKIGYLLEDRYLNTDAMNAFSKCCIFNDPGNHGCYGAGRMAEKLGDPQKAIEYYRMSRWEGSLKRADELEAQLNSGK